MDFDILISNVDPLRIPLPPVPRSNCPPGVEFVLLHLIVAATNAWSTRYLVADMSSKVGARRQGLSSTTPTSAPKGDFLKQPCGRVYS